MGSLARVLRLWSRSCLPLVTASSRCFAMGYSPQFAAPRSLRLGPRLFRASTNRNQSGEKLFDSPIFWRDFVPAYCGLQRRRKLERSHPKHKPFQPPPVSLLTHRCVLFLCFSHRCVFVSSLFALYRSAVYGVFTPSISAQLRTALGPSHSSRSAARPNGKRVFHLPSRRYCSRVKARKFNAAGVTADHSPVGAIPPFVVG